MKILIFILCVFVYIHSFNIFSYLNIGNTHPAENSYYIDVYSINRYNNIKTNIRLAILYPYDEVFLNVESRIYKLQTAASNNNACAADESSFVRLETDQSKRSAENNMHVLCLAINISDMIGLMSKYRKRLYRDHVSDTDTISYLVDSGYFAS